MNKSIILYESNISNGYFAEYVIAKEVAAKSTLKETAYLYWSRTISLSAIQPLLLNFTQIL